jgi:ABC-type bacteriocin/lantibiotic exporter with double-glycine peptidase domain
VINVNSERLNKVVWCLLTLLQLVLRKPGHEMFRLDSITFFDPVVDIQRAMSAAAIAAIHDDIARMPMQYNTLIGDMGSSLSGGQRQRVILARAFYKQPKILFLDEATSHVDVMQEKAINGILKQLGITIVMIAHRPETIQAASRLIDLSVKITNVAYLQQAEK